jgi:hypothetical protein
MKLDWIKIKWVDYPNATKAILQIPIKIDGIEETQYIQLDTGNPETLLFGYQAHQILPDHPDIDKKQIHLNGSVGNNSFADFKFDILQNQGKDRADAGQQKIGLLGTDFFWDKVLVLDFKNDRIFISDSDNIIENLEYKFSFVDTYPNPMNFVVFDFMLNNEEIPKILYDCGSSISDLTFHRKKDWENYVGAYDESKLTGFINVNPVGRFQVYGYRIDGCIKIGDFSYNAPNLEYKDTDLFAEHPLLGTLGNHPFFDSCVIIDFINHRFGISK